MTPEEEEARARVILKHMGIVARRILMVLTFGEFTKSGEAYRAEERGKEVRWCYFLGIERFERDPLRIWICSFWDGKAWNEKELRARTYRSYLGAWWRAFLMVENPDIVIIKKPYSPRDWRPT